MTGTRGTCHTPVGPDGLIPFTPSERFPTIEACRAAHAKVKADIALHHQACLRWSPPLPASQPFLPYQPSSRSDDPDPAAGPEPVERVEGPSPTNPPDLAEPTQGHS